MGGGGGKKSEIDKVSSQTKEILRKMVLAQAKAEKQSAKAVAKDTALYKEQMDLQNSNTQNMQNLYSQMITEQGNLANQYKTGLAQQLSLLQQQNQTLNKQATEQTNYYKSQQDFQKQQLDLQLKQKKKAEQEAQYTSALERQEATNAGRQANGLLMQINRRRALGNTRTNRGF